MGTAVSDTSTSSRPSSPAVVIEGLREVVTLFLVLNLWLAPAAILMVAATASTLGVSLAEISVGLYLPSLLVYVVYVRDRRRISGEDLINHPDRTRLVEKYDAPLHASEVFVFLAYELLVFSNVPWWTRAGVVSLGLYHLPLAVLYWYSRLKGTPGIDSLAVAVAWATLVVTTVLAFAPVGFSGSVLVVFLTWVAVVFAGVESRNANDIDGDEQFGNPTLASALGRRRTKLLERILKFGGLVVFWRFGGVRAVVLVSCYLLYLRVSRSLSRERTVDLPR